MAAVDPYTLRWFLVLPARPRPAASTRVLTVSRLVYMSEQWYQVWTVWWARCLARLCVCCEAENRS